MCNFISTIDAQSVTVSAGAPTATQINGETWYVASQSVRWHFRPGVIMQRVPLSSPMGPGFDWTTDKVGTVRVTRHNWAKIQSNGGKPQAQFEHVGDKVFLKISADKVVFQTNASWIEGQADFTLKWKDN